MITKRLLFLCCFATVVLTASLALADTHARSIPSRPAIARSSPRITPINRNSSTTFHRGNGSWNRVAGNRNLTNRTWNRGNGNWNRWSGNWRNRHGHSRIIFIGGFGYPWYYPYSYYNYYPYSPYGYGPYGYDPYGYSYYNQGGYQAGGGAYNNEGAYDDNSTYNNGNAYRGGAAANTSIVAQVQRNLARGGYYKGAIDGEMGPRTYYAIRSYQRSHNLRVDGAINDQFLSSIGLR